MKLSNSGKYFSAFNAIKSIDRIKSSIEKIVGNLWNWLAFGEGEKVGGKMTGIFSIIMPYSFLTYLSPKYSILSFKTSSIAVRLVPFLS